MAVAKNGPVVYESLESSRKREKEEGNGGGGRGPTILALRMEEMK